MTLRIGIADDHEMVRIGLERVISMLQGMRVVAQFADAHQLIAADLQHIDVLLLDLNMPGSDGVACITILTKRYPALKIVVFSMLPEDSFAHRTMAAGAGAYLNKNAPPEEVVKAIEAVAARGRYVPASQDELLQSFEFDRKHEMLSDREFQVLILVAGGLKPTEVAEKLGVRIGTVTTHIHRVKRKLGARSLGDLVAYAHRHRLLGY